MILSTLSHSHQARNCTMLADHHDSEHVCAKHSTMISFLLLTWLGFSFAKIDRKAAQIEEYLSALQIMERSSCGKSTIDSHLESALPLTMAKGRRLPFALRRFGFNFSPSPLELELVARGEISVPAHWKLKCQRAVAPALR